MTASYSLPSESALVATPNVALMICSPPTFIMSTYSTPRTNVVPTEAEEIPTADRAPQHGCEFHPCNSVGVVEESQGRLSFFVEQRRPERRIEANTWICFHPQKLFFANDGLFTFHEEGVKSHF